MATIERLRKRPDFLAAAEGRRFHTERMTAQGRVRGAHPRDGQAPEGLRLGFTITKRVGKATERNRIRRRLRAAVAVVAADLPADVAALSADVVLIARRPALDAAFALLAEDLRRAIPTVTRPRAPAGPGGERPAKRAGRGRSRSTSTRRDGGHVPAPIATPNTCGGVPDGQ